RRQAADAEGDGGQRVVHRRPRDRELLPALRAVAAAEAGARAAFCAGNRTACVAQGRAGVEADPDRGDEASLQGHGGALAHGPGSTSDAWKVEAGSMVQSPWTQPS